ncbi:hypothetical protein EV715DRAFT_296886 [Schizophyllum commune]
MANNLGVPKAGDFATIYNYVETLLNEADYVTLYVPEMSEMGREQFAQIKGVYLLNNAGGKVVNIPALINALKVGDKLEVDVLP